jgi:hypothetical protein
MQPCVTNVIACPAITPYYCLNHASCAQVDHIEAYSKVLQHTHAAAAAAAAAVHMPALQQWPICQPVTTHKPEAAAQHMAAAQHCTAS